MTRRAEGSGFDISSQASANMVAGPVPSSFSRAWILSTWGSPRDAGGFSVYLLPSTGPAADSSERLSGLQAFELRRDYTYVIRRV